MTVQTAYEAGIGKALPGMPYDLTDHAVMSRIAQHTAIRYGAVVVQGDDEYSCRLPDAADLLGFGASGAVVQGISMREHIREDSPFAALAAPLGNGQTSYVHEQDTVAIKTTGRIWVVAEVAVNQGEDVFYRHTQTGGTDLLGAIRNDADTATATQINKARFLTTAAAADDLVVVDLNALK